MLIRRDLSEMHCSYICIFILGSRLNSGQTVPGLLADFNMWQHEKTADQLNSGTCGVSGDVVSWNTLREQGSAVKTHESFPACNGDPS